MKNNILFLLLLCIIIIDTLSFNIVNRCIFYFNKYVTEICVDFVLTKVFKKRKRRQIREEFIDKVIKEVTDGLKKVPPFSYIMKIINAVLTLVEIVFLMVIMLWHLVKKVDACTNMVTSINKSNKSNKKTLQYSMKWIKLLTYMAKTSTNIFLTPNFWSDPGKLNLIGKMMFDVRNQGYVAKKFKEISIADTKTAIASTIGQNGCFDLDMFGPPMKAINRKIPKVVAPLIDIFKFIKPIIYVDIPGMPKSGRSEVYKVDKNLDAKYKKLMNEKMSTFDWSKISDLGNMNLL